MLVKTQNYITSVYRFNAMLVKTQIYLISVYRCNMLVKTQNYVIFVLTHLCSLKRKFANTDVSVFPVLAKILKYIILNPLPACVGFFFFFLSVYFFEYTIYIIDKQKDFQRQEEIDIKKQQKICSVIDGAWERVCVHICWIHVRRSTGACICPKCV